MFLNAGTFGNIPFLAGKKTQDTDVSCAFTHNYTVLLPF